MLRSSLHPASRARLRAAWIIGITAILSACTERPATAPDVGRAAANVVTTPTPTTSDINAAGGALADGSDGLRLWTSYGRYQIRRNNVNQIFSQSDAPASLSFGLWTEDGLFAKDADGGYWWSVIPPAFTAWVQTSNLLTTVSAGTWQNVEVLEGTKNGRTYTLKVTTDYTTPNGYADVTSEVTLPSGVTVAPQLYFASDFQLNGSDVGAGATGTVNGRRYVVQQGNGLVGGLMEGGVSTDPGFDSYIEDMFPCTFGGAGRILFPLTCGGVLQTVPSGPAIGGYYPNSVNADPGTDAGVGAHWDLKTTATGTVTRKVKLYFDLNLPGFQPVRPLTLTANNQSVAFLTEAPANNFYTYTVTDATGDTVTPTFTTAPTCTSSSYFVPAQALSFPITCSGAASAGDTYTYVDGTLSVTPAPLTVTYTGASGVLTPLPATLSLSATLAPDICAEAGTVVTYAIVPDPTTGTGSRTITNGVSTAGWLPGVYAITATAAGNSYCGASSDVGVLTVANPGTTGDATTGGGHYTGSTTNPPQSNVRVNFGHTVQTTSQLDRKTGNTTRTYRGNLLWMVTSGWRLNGAIASTTVRTSSGALVSGSPEAMLTIPCPAGVGTSSSKPKCGEFTGTGVLQQYDPVAKNWKTATQLGANGTVSFKATIYDGGSVSTCKSKTCTITDFADSFGLTMTGVTKANGVPVGTPALLLKSQNGSIVIR